MSDQAVVEPPFVSYFRSKQFADAVQRMAALGKDVQEFVAYEEEQRRIEREARAAPEEA